jgi:hypothetical protein
MDLGSIFLGLALALIVGVILARPLFEHAAQGVSERDRQLSMAQAERDRILNRLQELEMDYAMGKVIQSDYEGERRLMMQQGADVLREIDNLRVVDIPAGEALSLDAQIEAAVASTRSRSQLSGGFCTNCGASIQAGDLFCTRCGQAVQSEVADA